jgi:hypothetical protein
MFSLLQNGVNLSERKYENYATNEEAERLEEKSITKESLYQGSAVF